MNEAELEANTPTEGPALTENSGDLEREVEASDVVDNLETMQITEEEPSNQQTAGENVAEATTPTPEPAQLRPACQQAASGAFRIDRKGDELAETITGILPYIGVEEVDKLDTATFYHKSQVHAGRHGQNVDWHRR